MVRPLASALREGGLDVWYDEFELIGDSLGRKIDAGLARSRFGVVVMSRQFFRTGWTNYELDGIVTKVVTGEQILLPIWHNVSKQEVIDYSPSLADKLARSTATHTVKEIAAEIISVIKAACPHHAYHYDNDNQIPGFAGCSKTNRVLREVGKLA